MSTSLLSLSRFAAAALVATLVAIGPGGAGAATHDELRATQDRIAQTLSELRSIDGRAEQTEAQLAEAEERVAELEADLNLLLEQLAQQQARVDAAQAEADRSGAERERIQGVVNERARRAFIGAEPSPLLVLASKGIDDVTGALERLTMLEVLTGRADASIETLDAASINAAASADRLAVEVAALEDVRATREMVLEEAEVVMAERSTALQALSSERERVQAEHEQLEEAADELQAIIDREAAAARKRAEDARKAAAAAKAAAKAGQQSTASAPSAPRPSASGCYQWPASGAVTSEYGPRWGRMHAGLDIDGDTGDSLVAAQSGTVIYAGYDGAYGNLTLISHSDGVTTAYAHQSKLGVSKGQNVGRGEYIGKMGATGRVTGSHLHFETRTSSGAKNPRNYLC